METLRRRNGLLEGTPENSDDLPLPWGPEALNWLDKLVHHVRLKTLSPLYLGNAKPGVVILREEPKPPTSDGHVQALLWKIRDAGIDSDTMALVNSLLMRVWKDPGTYLEPKHHPLVG